MIAHEETKDKFIKSWIISICIFLNIFAFIIILNLLFFRIDMTHDKSYSVSKPTIELLNKIDPENPMIIEYYYLDKCKEFAWMAQVVKYIEDMLHEYETASGGLVNVIIKQLNYEKNRSEIDKLEKQGFQSFQLRQTKESEAKVFLGYSGLLLKYKNSQQVIPMVFQDTGFEYNLDIEIKKMVETEGNKIGLLFAVENKTLEYDFSNVYNLLAQDYKSVEIIKPQQQIANDIGVMVIIGASNLTDTDILNIDQFLMSGGKAFIALNGTEITITDNEIKAEPNDSKLIDLLSYYGIKINKDLVGDNDYFTPITHGDGSQTQQFRYPIWPKIKQDNFHKHNIIVKDLPRLNLFWPSSIEVDDNIKSNVELLFNSTMNSWNQTKNFVLTYEDYEDPEKRRGIKEFNFAYSFKGKLNSYYKERNIPESINKDFISKKGILREGETQLIIVSNEYLLYNNFMQDNESTFFLNSIDTLANTYPLIQIRNKGKFSRPLDKGSKEQKEIKRTIIIAFNTIIIPVLILIMGILVFISRKAKNKKIKEKFKQ
ncbi:MAG: GldG family protein [Spirochaetes bacterium]|nr:GldG family protein [Spirochaetota bacterium]